MEPQNTHDEKCWTHELTTRKNFEPKKYLEEKTQDPGNTHEKVFWTHGIPTRKNFKPTKARWHRGTRPTRPTMTQDPRNLAHSTEPMATKLGRIVAYLKGLLPKITQPFGLVVFARSRDKLKPLYLHYYSAYDHQTWQGCDLPSGTPIFIVTWHFNYVVLQDHVTN